MAITILTSGGHLSMASSWESVGTSNYRALSHKYTFTNTGTQIQVPLWKQPSSSGKETFLCNFLSPCSDQDKIPCCHNLLHLVSVANYQDRFCDVSSSYQRPNQNNSALIIYHTLAKLILLFKLML